MSSSKGGKARRREGETATPLGLRERKKATTLRRITTAALELFQSRGFEATTTRAIARRAGIAEGTLFNYFRTKEDVALHFFELEVEHAIAAVQENARLRKAALDEKLFALIEAQLEYLAPYERFIGAAVVQAITPGSRLGPANIKAHGAWVRYLGYVQDLVDEAVQKKEIHPVGWWATQAYWVYYMTVVLFWLHDQSPGKQHTLAFLDRSLKTAIAMLRRR